MRSWAASLASWLFPKSGHLQQDDRFEWQRTESNKGHVEQKPQCESKVNVTPGCHCSQNAPPDLYRPPQPSWTAAANNSATQGSTCWDDAGGRRKPFAEKRTVAWFAPKADARWLKSYDSLFLKYRQEKQFRMTDLPPYVPIPLV